MNLTMLLDMVVEGMPDRVLIGDRADGLTASELARRARSGSDLVRAADAGTVVYLGGNGPAFPVALFAGGLRRRAVQPDQLPAQRRAARRADRPQPRLGRDRRPAVAAPRSGAGRRAHPRRVAGPTAVPTIRDRPARPGPRRSPCVLFTSGTTVGAEGRAAAAPPPHVLRARLPSIWRAADEDDAALVSVPPYHIAGSGEPADQPVRRPAHRLPRRLRPRGVVEDASPRRASPTPWSCRRCCARIVDAVDAARRRSDAAHARLRRRPDAVIVLERALRPCSRRRFRQRLWPHRDLLHHRRARARRPPRRGRQRRPRRARAPRLGRPAGARHRDRAPRRVRRVAPGEVGIICRARRAGLGRVRDRLGARRRGWFRTRDRGFIDDEGYLFIEGRADDTIIRGGENIAPAEIESVLTEHPWRTWPWSASPTTNGASASPPLSSSPACGRTPASCATSSAACCGVRRPPTTSSSCRTPDHADGQGAAPQARRRHRQGRRGPRGHQDTRALAAPEDKECAWSSRHSR